MNISDTDPRAAPKPLRIGPLAIDPPVLAAPMAGFTNYAFRQIVRRLGGAGLLATEMVSARGFLAIDRRGDRLPERLWGVKDEPRPLAVQIWDNDPDTLAQVAARLVDRFDVSVVDINFGCPVKRVTHSAKSGSYLLGDPERMGQIIRRVVAACGETPVTAKIRIGYTRDTINAVDVAQAVEAAGAAALTVHGRTADQMFRGRADWQQIARVKPRLRHIPLIGNGDIDSAAAACEAFERYPVDGIMIGRAGLTRPWLFKQIEAALHGRPLPPDPTLSEQRDLLLDHYRLVCERFGPAKGTILMRRFACRHAQGHPGARAFRGHVAGVATPEEFAEVVARYFPTE